MGWDITHSGGPAATGEVVWWGKAVRFRAPANVFLHRAQVVLLLTAAVPTVLTTPVGILLLASGTGSVPVVSGVLVLAFCASSLTGYMLGSIFLRRGASLARIQHDFLSSVSHELRTPITSMRMFLEALRDRRLTDADERDKCLAIMQQELGRLDGLVGRLIDLSRFEAGREAFVMAAVSAQEVVDGALAGLAAAQLGAAPRLEVAVDPGLLLWGDRAALVQVLVNLLTNAWKYTGADKRIAVTARARTAREAELVVCDNGPGIAHDEQRRIFDKFTRGKHAIASGIDGTGLGLSIVQAIVRAHRGRIELRSAPGRGACFHVFVPRPAEVRP